MSRDDQDAKAVRGRRSKALAELRSMIEKAEASRVSQRTIEDIVRERKKSALSEHRNTVTQKTV